jgi:hypothetical protein
MRKIFTPLFLLGFMLSFAQLVHVKEKNSFYLGQRGCLGISLVNQPSVHPMFSSTEIKDFTIAWNINPRIDYTFALSNNQSIQIHGSVGINSRQSNNYISFHDQGTYYNGEIGTPHYKEKMVGLQYNWFFKGKGSIAPLGHYFGLGISRRFVNATHKNMYLRGEYDWQSQTYYDNYSLADFEFNYVANRINMQYGIREMITNQLYYDLVFDGGLSYGIKPVDESTLGHTNPNPDVENLYDDLYDNTRSRYFLKDLLTLNVGLGWVIH